MSHLLLLLTISAVGFPPLESFLLLPAARTGCVDPRTTAAAHQSRATAGASVSSSRSEHQTLSRARRTLKHGRCWNPFPRAATAATTRPPLILSSAAAAGGSEEAGNASIGGHESSEPGEPGTSDREQTQPRAGGGGDGGGGGGGERKKKKTKRPRSHVPVLEEGGGGERGGFVGEPWVGVTSPQSAASSLPEPDHKARQKFGRIMEDVLAAEKEEELPALLTKHIDFLLSVDVTRLTNDLIRLHKINSKCSGSFETYRKCLDKTQMNFGLCRKEEEVFHAEFHAEP